MLNAHDARRRWFGSFFVFTALGLLIWGSTLLAPYLAKHPLAYVLFWGACACCTGLALATALLDMAVVRRRTREEKKALIQKVFPGDSSGEDQTR